MGASDDEGPSFDFDDSDGLLVLLAEIDADDVALAEEICTVWSVTYECLGGFHRKCGRGEHGDQSQNQDNNTELLHWCNLLFNSKLKYVNQALSVC